jgi:uncharacterized protein (DUF924 family)
MCYGRGAWRHQKYNMCNVVENTSIVKPCVNGIGMQTHEILPEKTMFFYVLFTHSEKLGPE